jgi:acyl-CoA dehydrogenase
LKKEVLPQVTAGEVFYGIAMTEPGGGSDIVGEAKAKVEQQGDKRVLNGEKIYLSGITESKMWGGVHQSMRLMR